MQVFAGLVVARALLAAAEAAAEERLEDVVDAGETAAAAEGIAAHPAAALVGGAVGVVLLAALRVAQHFIRQLHFLEALVGTGVAVDIRVVLARPLAVRLLDLVGRRLAADAQDFVQVYFGWHAYCSCLSPLAAVSSAPATASPMTLTHGSVRSYSSRVGPSTPIVPSPCSGTA